MCMSMYPVHAVPEAREGFGNGVTYNCDQPCSPSQQVVPSGFKDNALGILKVFSKWLLYTGLYSKL